MRLFWINHDKPTVTSHNSFRRPCPEPTVRFPASADTFRFLPPIHHAGTPSPHSAPLSSSRIRDDVHLVRVLFIGEGPSVIGVEDDDARVGADSDGPFLEKMPQIFAGFAQHSSTNFCLLILPFSTPSVHMTGLLFSSPGVPLGILVKSSLLSCL